MKAPLDPDGRERLRRGMKEYPEKTCEIDRLIRHPRLRELAKVGKKTEQRRDGLYAYPGETFELDGVKFIVTDVVRQKLGEMTDEDARREGFPSLAAYRALIFKRHPSMRWDPEHLVWVHKFRKIEDG